ncbi:hypothetical protein BHE74_00011006, partial [Ensete ventricosum]
STVRAVAPPVYPIGYLCRVDHVDGPAVRGYDDLAARSAFVISDVIKVVEKGFGVRVRSQHPRRVAGDKESLPSVRGLHVGTAHPEGSHSCLALLIGCVLPESMGPAAQHQRVGGVDCFDHR